MKYGHCFLKPGLALFIMKWNFLWFPFYLNTDCFFQDIFFSSTKSKPGYFAAVVAVHGSGWEVRRIPCCTRCCLGPASVSVQWRSRTTFGYLCQHKDCFSYTQFQRDRQLHISFLCCHWFIKLCESGWQKRQKENPLQLLSFSFLIRSLCLDHFLNRSLTLGSPA